MSSSRSQQELLATYGIDVDKSTAVTIVSQMRFWVLECQWIEDADEILDMSDAEIVRGVNKHYGGGVEEFARTI